MSRQNTLARLNGSNHSLVRTAAATALKVLPFAQTIHRSGSSALNLAYIAAGRLDGYWSTSLKPWDMAAGALLVIEAGGKITRMDKSPLNLEIQDLLATNGTAVHDELSRLLTS